MRSSFVVVVAVVVGVEEVTVVEVIVGAVAAAKSRRALVRGGSPQMVPRNGMTLPRPRLRLLRSATTITLWAFPEFRTGFDFFFFDFFLCCVIDSLSIFLFYSPIFFSRRHFEDAFHRS